MTALLNDALLPNLVQTVEGVPAFVHGGPFANIAHGCNSVLATQMALAHADWVVTEAGFAFDLGGEKFFDIKCRSAGLDPAAVVLVATVRALKRHGGARQGRPRQRPTRPRSSAACDNLEKHIESALAFGKPPVVAHQPLRHRLRRGDRGGHAAPASGSACPAPWPTTSPAAARAAVELARAVVDQAGKDGGQPYRPLYDWSEPIKTKMEKIARAMYGAERRDLHLQGRARPEADPEPRLRGAAPLRREDPALALRRPQPSRPAATASRSPSAASSWPPERAT